MTLADDSAAMTLELEPAFVCELAIGFRDGVMMNPQIDGQRSDRG
jgi:hypothetical protein